MRIPTVTYGSMFSDDQRNNPLEGGLAMIFANLEWAFP